MKKQPCSIQEICRICPYVNKDYDRSLNEKHQSELSILKKAKVLEDALIQRIVPSPRKLGYRTVFKLAVRKNPEKKSSKRFRIGLFHAGSHQIGPDLSGCPLHAPLLRNLLKKLGPILEDSTLTPFDEKTHQGDIRYLIGRTNTKSDSLMLTWVVTHSVHKELEILNQKLIDSGIPLKVSAMNLHPEKNNAIWGKKTEMLTTQTSLMEKVCNLNFEVGPLSFFQVNPWQAENIYKKIESQSRILPERKVAWDLFSGVGPISLCLSKHFERILAIEENFEAVSFAKASAKLNSMDKKVFFFSDLVEKSQKTIPAWAQSPNLIVVNPSRRGIHEEGRKLILRALRHSPQSVLIYLSCSVETFARDLKYFKREGLYLKELQGFDMLAQTDQLEWLGLLKFN